MTDQTFVPIDRRILDPRVEAIAQGIHEHIFKYMTRLDHEGMYNLAIVALEALNSADALRAPFTNELIEP